MFSFYASFCCCIVCFCCVEFSFFNTTTRQVIGREASLKCPILFRVTRKTLASFLCCVVGVSWRAAMYIDVARGRRQSSARTCQSRSRFSSRWRHRGDVTPCWRADAGSSVSSHQLQSRRICALSALADLLSYRHDDTRKYSTYLILILVTILRVWLA